MIKEIIETKSIFWSLVFENNDIFLENKEKEKIKLTLEQLNKILSENIFNKKECNSSLLLAKDFKENYIFLKKDSKEYKDYLKIKDFEKKDLNPGNVFLYNGKYSVEKYKYITTIYENNINKNSLNEIYFYSSKMHIALNLTYNKIEYINLKNVVDLIEETEETFEKSFLKNSFYFLRKLENVLYVDTDKKNYSFNQKNNFNVYSFDKKMSKKESEIFFNEVMIEINKNG